MHGLLTNQYKLHCIIMYQIVKTRHYDSHNLNNILGEGPIHDIPQYLLGILIPGLLLLDGLQDHGPSQCFHEIQSPTLKLFRRNLIFQMDYMLA